MLITAIFAHALLAGAALALPSSGEGHVARRRGLPRRMKSGTPDQVSENWAGGVISSPKGTWKSVNATFIVPTPKVPAGNNNQTFSASAWVGIDGDTCQTAILQTGIDFNVDKKGSVSYDAWYEWFPDFAHNFKGITIRPGDSVTLTVTAKTATSGTAVIKNNSNGQTVSKSLTSTTALCQQDAEWIVEDFESGGSLVPFANFGTVTFTGASAKSKTGSSGPADAGLLDIDQDDKILTKASTTESSLTVSYVGN